MPPTIFFTGYPGFLGVELLPRLLRRSPDATARCLVQPKYAELARQCVPPAIARRVELVEGDITSPIEARSDDVEEIYHLAAVYDIMVSRPLAKRVNVEGTRNVLDFAERCPRLKRFHYVSTCYVSGRFAGTFAEEDLDRGQSFNNAYEETKFLAEAEVRRRMGGGFPANIYRPAVVVGDSQTGMTQKFDGPYYVIQWLLRQPRWAVLPVAGRPARYRFNVVPRDFIVAAIEHLSGVARPGVVYQLADPDPRSVSDTIDAIAEAAERRVLRIPLPRAVAKAALAFVPGLYALTRIPAAAVDYFVHPTHYSSTNTQRDLEGSGIRVPRFRDYLPQLIDFARAHPEIGSRGLA